ncbi:MAG: GNAT family N-acetyltransferase [Bacteroidota bacterium]|nr:GNAT family N-acetyltransferase [Bacteroidota bacterium]MEC8407920.1 GNAT family N-acetyltransferase [Bacteroidota bacterium]MEC8459486.1 GNAT family N-acetyltransferase [Bacteroidota bacterium]MEC8514010.1 GNAT family N-acetyltransferase [Bacteroidota bacterium]MEC9187066.1 GNAT family N-acetyltransferase [Bacteroidota bacterium]|tara:strand:- start:168 stop:608 length:441 start_codon:yes stop_codon:yes gene_type:complete
MFQSTIKRYNDLSKDQFFDILKLRIEIFVVEQCCYYQELDNEDKEAFHVSIYNDGIIVAVGRIIPNLHNKEVKIGRIAVKMEHRKKGLAYKMMKDIMNFISKKYKNFSVLLSAQTYLIEFYQSFGFKEIGNTYLEDGIEHINMVLK